MKGAGIWTGEVTRAIVPGCLSTVSVHCGTPCTKMCKIGARSIDESTEAQNEFTLKVALHQHEEGLGASVENPKGTLLYRQRKFVKHFGTPEDPKPGWSFYTSDGCQFQVVCPGRDDHERLPEPANNWETHARGPTRS